MEKKAGTAEKAVGKAPLNVEKIISQRKFYVNTKSIEKIMKVTKADINRNKRITKFELFKKIGDLKELSPYVPPIEEVKSCERFIHFIKKHKRVIVRPMDESEKKSNSVIEKYEDGYEITSEGTVLPRKLMLSSDSELAEIFKKLSNQSCKFVIQKYIKLTRVEQSVYDVRIVIKRVNDKVWKCLGIECQVGENIFILRCIGKDKYTIPLKEALRKTFPIGCNYEKVMRKINELCYRSCKSLRHIGENFNRFDFDIAIDENRKPWIVGINYYTNMQEYKVIDYSIYKPKVKASLLYAVSNE